MFKFARRHCSWHGENPLSLLEAGTAEGEQHARAAHLDGDELTQTLAAAEEPWKTLFKLGRVVGGRESELLGLWWDNLDLRNLERGHDPLHAPGRSTEAARVALKTEESKATLPLPRSTAAMMLAHKARVAYADAGQKDVRLRVAGPGARWARGTC